LPFWVPRYCAPHVQRASRMGMTVLPNSVIEYSTRGGTSGMLE